MIAVSYLHECILGADVVNKVKTIRREDKHSSLHVGVGSSGEFVRRHEVLANPIVRSEAMKPRALEENIDACDVPYLLGKANSTTTTCSNDHHRVILDLEDCRLAATEANAHLTHDWVVTEAGGWRDIRPRGCFMMACRYNDTHHNNGKEGTDDGGHGTCYFFNPIGDEPLGPIEGIAVCEGTMFFNGKNDTTGKEDEDCPDGYSTILNEDPCEEAADCLDDCLGWEARKANFDASKYDDYPLGCMIDHSDGCVYFNEPVAGRADPTRPKGVPICKVEKITHFPNDIPTARL